MSPHRIEPRFHRDAENPDHERIAQLESELHQAREALRCAVVRGAVPAVVDHLEALEAAGVPNVREAYSVATSMLARKAAKPRPH
jgi:hypothetical protein